MIKRALVLSLLLIAASVFANTQKLLNISVQGLTCPFCIKVLLANLSALPTVAAVKISTDDQTLLVTMKPDQTPDLALIDKTIKNSGYLPLKTEESSRAENKTAPGAKFATAHQDVKSQPCQSCHNH